MSSVSRSISILLLIIFFGLGVFALFAAPAELMLFRPAPYLEALESQQFFERFPVLLASITANPTEPQPDDEENQLRYLNHEDYALIYAALFTPDWLREQAGSVLNQLFDHLNFVSPELRLVVSMGPVKERLASEQGSQIASRVVNSWPPCTAQQLLQIVGLGLTGQLEGFPTCRPPAELMGVAAPLLEFSVQGFAQTIPDEMDLADLIPARPAGKPLTPAQSPLYLAGRWALRLSPLLAGLVLALLLVGAVRNGRGLLGWMGAALGGAGLIGLGLALLAGLPLILAALGVGLGGLRVELGDEMTRALLAAGRHLAERYLLVVVLAAGAMAGLGAIMLAGRAVIRDNGNGY